MRIFWKNSVKVASASGLRPRNPDCFRPLGDPPPNPRVVIPTYYYKFVEFILQFAQRIKAYFFRVAQFALGIYKAICVFCNLRFKKITAQIA